MEVTPETKASGGETKTEWPIHMSAQLSFLLKPGQRHKEIRQRGSITKNISVIFENILCNDPQRAEWPIHLDSQWIFLVRNGRRRIEIHRVNTPRLRIGYYGLSLAEWIMDLSARCIFLLKRGRKCIGNTLKEHWREKMCWVPRIVSQSSALPKLEIL